MLGLGSDKRDYKNFLINLLIQNKILYRFFEKLIIKNHTYIILGNLGIHELILHSQ